MAFFGVLGVVVALLLVIVLLNRAAKHEALSESQLVPDANWNRELLADSSPVVLQLSIDGTIGLKDLSSATVQEQLLKSQEGALKGRVKAILVKINTGGGSAIDSYEIYQMLKSYKERHKVPIYAYCEGPALSGGYFVACAADQIYASPVSMVGSVGVISMPFFNVSDTMEKIGVKEKTLMAGKGKDTLNPFRPWKSDEGEELQPTMDAIYKVFRDVVAQARPKITADMLAEEYGARIFSPEDGLKAGYIDGIEISREETLKLLTKAGGIAEGTHYQVVDLSEQHWLSHLLSSSSPFVSGRWIHELTMGSEARPAVIN
jgi:protease-4